MWRPHGGLAGTEFGKEGSRTGLSVWWLSGRCVAPRVEDARVTGKGLPTLAWEPPMERASHVVT